MPRARAGRADVRVVAALTTAVVGVGAGCAELSPARDRLRWQACEPRVASTVPGLECATFDVPEDRSRAAGRTLSLPVVRVGSTGGSGAEPVVALSGGPGDPSTPLASVVAQRWPEALARRAVVLLDQRGTGGMPRLHCDTRIAEDPASAFAHVFDPARLRICRERVGDGVDRRAFTTEAAAADLDELRQALGHERILLWGGSYGTRLALTYMQRYPDRVAFAVLDGVAPPGMSLTTRYAATLQNAIERANDDCDARPDCAIPLRPIARDLEAIVARLRDGPAETTVTNANGQAIPVTLGLGAAAYSIRGILYGARGFVELPAVLRAAARGDFQQLAQRYWERAMRFRGLATGLHLSVMCVEDVPPAGHAEADRVTEGTLLGRYLLDDYRRACEAWGVPPTGRLPPPLDAPLSIPTLLLSGRFDPSTPPEYAEQVARFLPRSRHDIADAGHGVSFGCARETVSLALALGTFEGVPVACPR